MTFNLYKIGTDYMFRISKMADYAVSLLAELASGDTDLTTSVSLAARTSLPEPTVAKVIKTLAKGGILTTQRGAKGGYRMARPLSDVTVTDIITLFDGPIALTSCVDEDENSSACKVGQFCRMRGRWQKVSIALRATFDGLSIQDLIADTNITGCKATHLKAERPTWQ